MPVCSQVIADSLKTMPFHETSHSGWSWVALLCACISGQVAWAPGPRWVEETLFADRPPWHDAHTPAPITGWGQKVRVHWGPYAQILLRVHTQT